MATFFESGTWVWIPDEDEVVLPAKAKTAFRLGERATVIMENGAVSGAFSSQFLGLFSSRLFRSRFLASRPDWENETTTRRWKDGGRCFFVRLSSLGPFSLRFGRVSV